MTRMKRSQRTNWRNCCQWRNSLILACYVGMNGIEGLIHSFITSLICFSIPIQSYSSLLFIFGIQAYDIHRVTETYVARLAVFKQNSLPLEIYKTFSIVCTQTRKWGLVDGIVHWRAHLDTWIDSVEVSLAGRVRRAFVFFWTYIDRRINQFI